MKLLTIEEFNSIPNGEVFTSGFQPNSPEGIFMTRDGGNLCWLAKKGYGNDWAIYCHWQDKTLEWIEQHGDKVHDISNIQHYVPYTDEVMNLYRF